MGNKDIERHKPIPVTHNKAMGSNQQHTALTHNRVMVSRHTASLQQQHMDSSISQQHMHSNHNNHNNRLPPKQQQLDGRLYMILSSGHTTTTLQLESLSGRSHELPWCHARSTQFARV